eukprot:6214384-Pyramimonas_sp.AAC.1
MAQRPRSPAEAVLDLGDDPPQLLGAPHARESEPRSLILILCCCRVSIKTRNAIFIQPRV